MSDPWFRFFPSDWLAGVSGLSAAERGVYITILAMIYDHGAAISRDDARLARQCGLPKAGLVRALEGLLASGKLTQEGECLSNSRAKSELTERENRKLKATEAATSRWEKDKENQTQVNAEAMPERYEPIATRAPVLQPQPQPQTEERERATPGTVALVNGTGKSKRATRIPESFQPDEKTLETGISLGHPKSYILGVGLDEFRDFWLGVPGARGTKLDWQGTYRNRLRQTTKNPIVKRQLTNSEIGDLARASIEARHNAQRQRNGTGDYIEGEFSYAGDDPRPGLAEPYGGAQACFPPERDRRPARATFFDFGAESSDEG